MIRVAMLGDFPIPSEIEASVGLPQATGFVATPIVNLVGALGERSDVTVEMVRITKGLQTTSIHRLSERVRLHLLPAGRVSGMPAAFVPRVLAMRKYVRRLDCDIVHGQGTEAGYAWMAMWAGLPHVITVHGILRLTHRVSRPPVTSVEHIGRWVETASFKRARNIIAISDFVHQQLAPIAPRAKFFSAGNPISKRFFETDLSRVPIEPLVVYLGRITPEKGLIDLIKAAGLLEELGVDLRIAVVGRASGRDAVTYEEECRDLAGRLKSIHVDFHGWLSDEAVWELLERATCLALPSHDESFSMAVAESMALGTPAVAYAAGAVPERMAHGVSGLLVADGDIQGFADALKVLLDDPAAAQEMGRAAREKAREWNPDSIAEKTVAAYKTILNSSRKG